MFHRFALVAAVAATLLASLHIVSAHAQETAPACASAVWLEPLTTAAETDETAAQPADAPAWLTAELTDACSGETFALADFAGKTLYIEPMATWCVNCHAQMTRVKDAAAMLPEEARGSVVLVALSSEVDLPRETLAQYAVDNDFPFIFAVVSAEMLRAMVDALGQEVTVPPATPHLIVAPDGTVGPLRTGSTSTEDLLTLFTEAQTAAP